MNIPECVWWPLLVCVCRCGAEGVSDIRIIVGETENNKMEMKQSENFRRGKSRYTKLMPDLREAMRLGRRDFDSVHIWYLVGRTGWCVQMLCVGASISEG